MKKLVIIGASDLQNPLILKAKEMGYETHVFAWKCGDIGEKTADFFYPISIIEKDEILKKCLEIKPDGICTIASDLAGITVNYVASKMGLPCNDSSSIDICTNKYEMRKAFKKAGVKVPNFIKVGLEDKIELSDFSFPIIVKPTDRSGSRGITKLSSEEGLKEAIENSIENSFEKKAIIEEYIEGNEYSCECISYEGKHHFLAFTKKYTTGAPHFIENGHMEPSDIKVEYQEKIKKEIFKALDALNIKMGASHSEFKVDKDGNMRIIEIGARMGGDCIGSDLVRISTGYDFVKMVIECSVGLSPSFKKVCEESNALVKYVFSQNDLNKVNKIIDSYPDILFFSSVNGKFDHEVVDSGSRMGFFIFLIKDQQILNKVKEVLFDEKEG